MTVDNLIDGLLRNKKSNQDQAIVYIDNDLFFPVEDVIIKYGHLVIKCKNVRVTEQEDEK